MSPHKVTHSAIEHPDTMDDLLEPPTSSVRFHPHHSRDFALHKYLLLHEQHEFLRQHLDELRPSRQASICTPVSPSPAGSPTRRTSCSSDTPAIPRQRTHHRSSGGVGFKDAYRATVHRDDNDGHELNLDEEVALEEAKLCDVNEGMKRLLTELLNCETVRADAAFRTWVQCRLMDTERELRSGRRRRSAPS
ncbi:hypothetical protein VTJ49DRAFT_3821 [Mycothermus thermophilus]|uniref:Uncharacterized protein n=1 Tax=Humicola insolens TaxID=85995 RepID=A0ABR3VRD3_HUMIN